MILIWIAVALLASFLPLVPNEIDLTRLLVAPGENVLGTDDLGRDILSRLIVGASVSLNMLLLTHHQSLGPR